MTPPGQPTPPSPPPPRAAWDPVHIGCTLLFAVLLMIPAGGLLVALLVMLASVPLMMALFPTAITLGSVALAVLFWRYRRDRRQQRAHSGEASSPEN